MAVITVIVPVYKVEKYLRKCVDSILTQSFQDFDLVLVDDGSPDRCGEICDAYAEKDERITVIHKRNGGLSDARNTGIDWAMEHSDSSWLAFVDSDDYLHPDYLRILFQTAQKEKADLVICDFAFVNEEDEVIEEEHNFFRLVTEDKNTLFECLSKSWRIDMAWDKLYEKPIFDQLRFEKGKIHEDEFAIHHVLWNCRRAAIIDCSLYYYRIRENSIMSSASAKSKLDSMEASINQYEFLVQHGLPTREILFTSNDLNHVLDLRKTLGGQDLIRYKELKKKYIRIFYSDSKNRSVKGRLVFYFNRTGRKLFAARKRLKSRSRGSNKK